MLLASGTGPALPYACLESCCPCPASHPCLPGLQEMTGESFGLPHTQRLGCIDISCSSGWGNYTLPRMQLQGQVWREGVLDDRGPLQPASMTCWGFPGLVLDLGWWTQPRFCTHLLYPPGSGQLWPQQPQPGLPPGDSAGRPYDCSGTYSAGQRNTPRQRTGPWECPGWGGRHQFNPLCLSFLDLRQDCPP